MKRILAILLLSLFTIATSGAMVQMHYCGNNLASWNITINTNNDSPENCCCKPEKEQCPTLKNKCCSDDVVKIKIEQDYQASSFSFNLEKLSVAILPTPTYITYQHIELSVQKSHFIPFANAPPAYWQNRPLYSIYHSWKLYDLSLNNC